MRMSKACHRWTELYIHILFDRIITLPGCTSSNRILGLEIIGGSTEKIAERRSYVNYTLKKVVGEHAEGMEHIETVSRHGLLLAGECGSPLLSIFSMLASVELALIQGEDLYAINCWREIYVLLSVTYLQPLASDSQDDRCSQINFILLYSTILRSFYCAFFTVLWLYFIVFTDCTGNKKTSRLRLMSM